jgi:hypothetical protein
LRHARRAMRTPTAPAFFDSPRCEQQIANTRCASAAPMKNATSDFRARLAARQMCLNPGARRLSCRPLLCCATDAARADCDWQPYPSWPQRSAAFTQGMASRHCKQVQLPTCPQLRAGKRASDHESGQGPT